MRISFRSSLLVISLLPALPGLLLPQTLPGAGGGPERTAIADREQQEKQAKGEEKPPEKKEEKKEEVLPLKPERKIAFTTDEATWMSLDISPDGRQIVFDLLGDLYQVAIDGGEAKRLTSGLPWDCQPRFSPDGKEIAFISDRNGSDNIWRMDLATGKLRQVTKETDWQLSSPAWSPDGDYLVARKTGAYPGPDDMIRGVALWMYHKDGGKGVEVVKGRGATAINSGAVFSPDGKTVYFSSHPERFRYDTPPGRFQVHTFDRETGEVRSITAEYGGGLRPIVSPDGRYLVYASRLDAATGLRMRDLHTLDDRWLARSIQRDDQQGFASNDLLPGYAFTPDSKSVVYTAGGKIHRVDVVTHQASVIPFTAKVELDLGPRIRQSYKVSDGPLEVRQLRWMNQSPDGKRVVFSAVGKLWIADLASSSGEKGSVLSAGAPRRLTQSASGAEREFEPVFSPDGKWIAYVTWSNTEGGQLWKISSEGGQPLRLSPVSAFYARPAWSPDSSKIAYIYGSARGWLASSEAELLELRFILAAGGDSHFIVKLPRGEQSPVFSGDGQRIFYMDDTPQQPEHEGLPSRVLRSVRLDGVDKQSHLKFDGVLVEAIPSPDGAYVALHDKYDAYLVAFPRAGSQTISIGLQTPAVPVKRVTTEGGNYLAWADGGKTLTWSFANHFYRVPRDAVLRAEKREEWKPADAEIRLQVPRPIPQGKLLLRNARVVTMRGEEVIEHGDILIENNRISTVGPSGKIVVPSGAKVIDVRGETILPGLVDIHAHLGARRDIVTDQEWSYAANLAYGVTTTRDPSIDSNQVFAQGEMVEAGELVGPRIYSTGTAMVTLFAGIQSQEDADNVVRRYKRTGADSLKQYMQPRRIQREWLAIAAAREGMNITAEGGGDLKLDLSMALDGYTGVEHSLPVVPIYKDVIELEAQAKSTYTPTLIVSYGGPFGQIDWRQQMDIHADPKVMRFTPHQVVDQRARWRTLVLEDEFQYPAIARGAAEVVRRGGNVALGSHGEQQGIGAHWELWMLASGGMTPWQVFHCATMLGAESIGLENELGSIESGKLADLIVLNSDPLENIQNSRDLRYVIKNGVVYDADTLDEVWPVERKFPPFFWRAWDAEWMVLPKQ
jgi:Tol biopolymer transport system component/imidazolonepropionase-like amidohydrolase